MLPDLPKTGVVVPCYNEARRLPVAALVRFLACTPGVDLCLVNDGSRDATQQVLDGLARACPGRVSVVSLPRNSGKGEAVRQGVRHVLERGGVEFVGYWDADLATPLEEIYRLLKAGREAPQAQGLLGCRLKRLGAVVERRWRRHILGRFFATMAGLTLSLPVYDTQCGAKLFRTALAAEIFAQPFMSRWCFDVELIARTVALRGRQGACDILLEVPLGRWQDVAGSKLRLKHCAWAVCDLARIFWHYRRLAPAESVLEIGARPTAAADTPSPRRKAA